jgi:hypothetical protein
MDGQRQKSGWGRGRRRKPRSAERPVKAEPVLIAARRPDSPLIAKVPRKKIAASAVPRRAGEAAVVEPAEAPPAPLPEPARRAARIVKVGGGETDARERERLRLLGRLMACQGRGPITRAANEFLQAGFELPNEQEVHLQLLEHFDETRARESLEAISQLLEEQPPIKKPVLDQRLRRLEEHGDEAVTRDLAADLRRSLRS